MEPTAAQCCREVLDRLRAQVYKLLPPVSNPDVTKTPDVPLERLPTIGQVALQLIEGEAMLAAALAPPASSVQSGE